MSETPIGKLSAEAREISPDLNAADVFRVIRSLYCKNIEGSERAFMNNAGTEFPSADDIDVNSRRKLAGLVKGEKWDELGFHMKYRITEPEDLFEIFPETNDDEIKSVVEAGYLMSMLPMNAVLPAEVRKKYLPEPDYFDEGVYKSSKDPYGLFGKAKIQGKKLPYLASRKFKHSALMPISTFCPVGCAGCYRSYYTRERREKGEELGITSETILDQTDEFVEWLNQNPEVYDVIISGGEPLMAGNDMLNGMFERLGGAKNLKIARICTGALFQGLPFRIDEELLDNLSGFSAETGKRVTFNAHLSNHYQITPEALQAARRIKKRGIEIYSQVPIQQGVNFFREDLGKTMFYLTELGRRQAAAGIEPYKMMLDMHPRTQEKYVPIELLLKVWSNLGESHDYPELERPRTLSILCEQGNIILSGYALSSMRKEIDKENNAVIYKIPAVYSLDMHDHAMERTFTYVEPLIEGYNDDPKSLDKARKLV